ncbi:MAG: glycerophosphodiester phosphodiesterase family protein [Pyrinomonadaceae bacterium]
MNSTPLIIGHRGASALAPENTLAAFSCAFRDGADGIEFDVRLARDGVPVVIHDAMLKRTGLRDEAVINLNSSELGEVDTGTWFNLRHPQRARVEYSNERVPTLPQVFELFGPQKSLLYVEMKCAAEESAALAAAVASLVRTHNLFDRVVVKSFRHSSILEIKQIEPRIKTAALFEPKLARPLPSTRRMIQQTLSCKADEISLHHSLVSKRVVAEAHRHRFQTVVWTVDAPGWIRRAQALGIHAIITNNPAPMISRRASGD